VLVHAQSKEDPRCCGHIGELILEASSMDLTVWIVTKEIQVVIYCWEIHRSQRCWSIVSLLLLGVNTRVEVGSQSVDGDLHAVVCDVDSSIPAFGSTWDDESVELSLLLDALELELLIKKFSVSVCQLVSKIMVIWNELNRSLLFEFKRDQSFFHCSQVNIIPCSHVELFVGSSNSQLGNTSSTCSFPIIRIWANSVRISADVDLHFACT